MMLPATEIHAPQREAKYTCSACGSDRFCNCTAPALEKIAERMERDRQRKRRDREKAKENQRSRPRTEEGAEAVADAAEAYAEERSLTRDLHPPLRNVICVPLSHAAILR